jgi:hypothetical protein
MAIAADTIEILNGLDHEQDITTSILYSIDSATGSAVSTQAIAVPISASQANVIFNNDYDLDGSTVFVRVRVTKFTDGTAGAIVKTETTEALAWVEIPGGASEDHIIETGSIDVSDSLGTTLHIDVCLSSTTAHTGTEVIVQIASEAGVDGSWTNLTKYVCCVGTAILAALTATEPAGETVLAIANPVASGFDWDGKNLFIENTVAADSEIVYQTEHGADS